MLATKKASSFDFTQDEGRLDSTNMNKSALPSPKSALIAALSANLINKRRGTCRSKTSTDTPIITLKIRTLSNGQF